jgi:Uma2 family endonuclease
MSLVTGSGDPHTRPGVKLTYDDFVLFPDDGQRHELIDGEHYVTPSPNLKHQAISRNILTSIGFYLRNHPVGRIYAAPLDVVFSHFDVVEPDLLFVAETRREVLTAANVQGAPDLVVEIGSPSTRRRDEKLKHRLYERFGVSEYWVVDPDIDVIAVYRLMDGEYLRAQELSFDRGDVITTPLLPGLEIPLAVVFAD